MFRKKKVTKYTYDRRMQYMTTLMFVAAMVLLGWLTGRVGTKADYPIYNLHDGWNVIYDNKSFENTTLSDANFGTIDEGEEVTLSRILTEAEVRSACVYLRSSHSTITAYLDGVEIYTDGAQYDEELWTPGYYHYIPLPEGYSGKQLMIRIRANDDDAFSELSEVRIGNINDIYNTSLQQQRFTTVTGTFLSIMGLVLLFVFIYMCIYVKFFLRILSSAMISLVLGLYMMTYYKIANYITDDPSITTFVEYASLFAGPIFVALLMTIIREGRARYFSGLMTCLDLIMFLAAVTLQYGGEYPMNKLIRVFHVLIAAESVLLIIILFYAPIMRRRRRTEGVMEFMEPSERVLAEGLFAIMIGAFIEIFRFNVLKNYAVMDRTFAHINLITLGALVFIVSLVVHVFYYHIEHLGISEVKTNLEGLAYNDPLTNMANRGRFDQVISQIEKTGEPYTVISIDLDHLKEVNDTYGHAEGDRLLVRFAKALTESFEGAPLIGRVGGDEFAVVMDDTSAYETNDAIKRLELKMAEKNQEETRYRLEASYGAAFSYERQSAKEVIALADSRMYEMKRLRKGKKAGRPERQVRHAS